ncbi:MAG TPA: murein L,D-transpeptidase catalytic domain family protein, partial [Chitinophagaceae bacterium]
MKKLSYLLILTLVVATALLIPALSGAEKITASVNNVPVKAAWSSEGDSAATVTTETEDLFEILDLGTKGMQRETFDRAWAGYTRLMEAGKISNQKLSIVDFSQPSTKKRLYVIDVKERRLLFNTLVAHGRNSGELMAKRFSNTNESLQSSLGFYLTAEKYMGKHGLSLRMDGLEKTNSNARQRAIVVHGANYVSEQFAKSRGFIGRSWGCP